MANAYLCDRCKTYYERTTFLCQAYSKQHRLSMERNNGFTTSTIDLCPKCRADLDDWFSKGQPDKEQDHDHP